MTAKNVPRKLVLKLSRKTLTEIRTALDIAMADCREEGEAYNAYKKALIELDAEIYKATTL